jgi:Rrf2 family protein
MAANSQFSIAVHVLAVLARHRGETVSSERLAASVNTNPVVIRRILGRMGRAGLVASKKGASGGASLSISADRITMADVYRSVECGEVFSLHGRPPDPDCPVGRNIEAVLCRIQKEIDKTVVEKLSGQTLADVLESIETPPSD